MTRGYTKLIVIGLILFTCSARIAWADVPGNAAGDHFGPAVQRAGGKRA